MLPSHRLLSPILRWCSLLALAGIVLVSCQPTAQQTAAPPTKQSLEATSDSDLVVMARANNIIVCAALYERAKVAFKNAQWDRALDLTAGMATAPTSKTEHTHLRVRSRTMRSVIFAGQIEGNMALAEAYGQGADKTKNPQFKSAYQRLQNDALQAAAHAAVGLAETAHLIAPDGKTSKSEPLEFTIPPSDDPGTIAALVRVKEGGWIEPDQQESAAAASLRKGMDQALAEVVSGDLAKARTVFADGPANINGAPYVLFLAAKLADGAVVFDRHHTRDPQKLKMLCDEGQETLTAVQALLKATPEKDKEKEVQKLQDKFKTILKNG
jgi:hypothetical protein